MSYQCKKPVAEITLYILKHWKILKILIKIRIAVNKGRDAFHCWVVSSLLITYSTIHIAQTFSFWKITHNTKIIFPSWVTLLLIFHIFQFESFFSFPQVVRKIKIPPPSAIHPVTHVSTDPAKIALVSRPCEQFHVSSIVISTCATLCSRGLPYTSQPIVFLTVMCMRHIWMPASLPLQTFI